MKKFAYLSVFTSAIGASVISIDFGVLQLSLFRVLLILILFIMVSKLLLTNGKFNITKKRNSYSIMVMFVWLIYAFLSLIWVRDYSGWVRAIYFLSLGVLCVVIYDKTFKTANDILISFRIMAVMTMVHNIFGWYEIFTGNYKFLTNSQNYYAIYKMPVSMFGNTNDFATFMLISICILYVCIVNSKTILGKILYIITTISSIYLLTMSNSRANILGLIFAIIVFCFFSMKSRKKRKNLLILLIIFFSIVLIMPNYFSNIILKISQNLHFDTSASVGFGKDSDYERSNLIRNGFLFLIKTFGLGTGAGNIEYWMANYGEYPTDGITNIHNWWMEILTGYGVVIFILYVIFYLKLFRDLYKIYKTSENKVETTISLSVMCSMAGYVIGSISSSSNIDSEWLWVYWALVIAFQGNNSISKSKTINLDYSERIKTK